MAPLHASVQRLARTAPPPFYRAGGFRRFGDGRARENVRLHAARVF